MENIKITEIKDQELSTLIADFLICQNCKIVDRDKNRIKEGYKCPNCGFSSTGGFVFFYVSIRNIVDLVQEFYHIRKNNNSIIDQNSHYLAVIIFYCTLGEVLFDHFLQELMLNLKIKPSLLEKLLGDNQPMNKKKDLYKSLTNKDIKKDLKSLSINGDFDYNEIFDFYVEVRNTRNKILHRGYTWLIPNNMPENCINNLPGLLNLFVALHNKHIAQLE